MIPGTHSLKPQLVPRGYTVLDCLLIFIGKPPGKRFQGERGIDPQDFGSFATRLLLASHHSIRRRQIGVGNQVIGSIDLERLLEAGHSFLMLPELIIGLPERGQD